MPSSRRLILLTLRFLSTGGCATARSLDAYREGDPLIMAGLAWSSAASLGAPAAAFREFMRIGT